MLPKQNGKINIKKKAQLRLRLPRWGAQSTDEILGWRAETEISVRLAHGDTTSALSYNPRTGVKISRSRMRRPRGG
jgi:hypothetical protein